MCWTQRKADKLNYFKKTLMWYLNDNIANIQTLGNSKKEAHLVRMSPLKEFHQTPMYGSANSRWDRLSALICMRSDNSP